MSASSSRFSTPNPTTIASVALIQTTSHPAHKLLSRAHSPSTADTIFTNKIRNKPLLLHDSQTASDKRALRRHIRARKQSYHARKQRPKPLSAKEKRAKGIYDLNAENDECKYEVYQGLNALWRGYFLELMGLGGDAAATRLKGSEKAVAVPKGINVQGKGSLIASMDYHGMEVEVVRCVDVGRVGLRGIIVRETKFTFVLVCPGDKVRRVLKKGAIFKVEVEIDGQGDGSKKEDTKVDDAASGRKVIFELHGDQLEIRPVERAVKKFKWKPMEHL